MNQVNDLLKNFFYSIPGFFDSITNFYLLNQSLLEQIGIMISGILAFFIVFFIIRLGIIEAKKEFYIDVLGGVNISKRRALKSWGQVQARLKTKKESQSKIIISECDKILDELIKINGIKGRTVKERMEQLTHEKISNLDELISARRIILKIKSEPDLKISWEEVENIVATYKTAYKDLGLFD